ncbi:MAG: BolA/IbaG family iron-sulfur metabolism protein [Pseudobdellovibrionaceae bacterium]
MPMTPQQIKQRLNDFYQDGSIEVFDLTGTENHYEVSIESAKFTGLSRIQQHQQVMSCFSPELKTGEVHALSIKTKIKT